jgi:D-glucuronyl C5-epimerase-like protein
MSRTIGYVSIALVCTLALGASAPGAGAAKPKSVARVLNDLLAQGAIDQPTRDADRAVYDDAKATAKRLTGARKAQLSGAIKAVEDINARGDLRAARLAPLFLTLQRNREWWGTQPLPASGARISFPGSELIWQYVPGQGLQLHPLADFGKLNAYAKGRKRNYPRMEQMLDELLAIAVPRGGGLAWEYYFTFDGGKPPWVSGLAQGTGLQAIARAATKLGRLPELLPTIQQGLTLFEQPPPTGVRIRTASGAHYVQYSFWPSLRVLNGFVQSLNGLFDVAQLTGDPRAAQLFADGDREARVEVPTYDTGAWSLYSRNAITRESDLSYHTLLRDFLAQLCDRTGAQPYCTAEAHFTTYLTVPPALALRTARLRGGKPGALKFSLSKISRATVRVTGPNGNQVLAAGTGVVGRGTRAVTWKVPRKPGAYTVQVDATDLAGNAGTARGAVEVLKPKPKRKHKRAK